jgi:hypothetical protein
VVVVADGKLTEMEIPTDRSAVGRVMLGVSREP